MENQKPQHYVGEKHPVLFFLRTLFFCLLATCLYTTVGYAQNKTGEDVEKKMISLEFANEKLDNALATLEQVSGFRLIYPSEPVDKAHLVNLPKETRSVAATLRLMLQGTTLDFSQSGSSIVLFAKKEQPKPATATGLTLHGAVTDAASGEVLPYASVVGKVNKTTAVYTDEKGDFSITFPSNETHFTVSFMGYKDAMITIGAQRDFKVALEPEAVQLDETIVVGYQTRKKSTLTGSVKSLDSKVIQDKPVASFDKAIQGQVAGVYTMSSGVPGGSSSMLIRGVTSVNYTAQPLYILDGTPISPENFASLNPNDIETYTVLKDAAATSIYGSLAANGVVLLTSKRGKNMERSEVTYRFQIGTSMLTGQNFTMMNTQERLGYEERLGMRELDATGHNYLYRDAQGNVIRTESKDSLMNINVNWRDAIYRKGLIQSHELGLRGGSENTRYYASFNYFGQAGILPSSDFKRLAFRVNLDHTVNKFLKVGTSTALGREFRKDAPTGSMSAALAGSSYNPVTASYIMLPYMNPYNADGELVDFVNTDMRNPLLYYTMSEMSDNRIKVVTNIYAELKLAKFLTFKSSLGYDYQDKTNYSHVSPEWDGVGSVSRGYYMEQNLTNTNLFTFKHTIKDKHNLTILLGEESLMSNDRQFDASGQNLANSKVLMLLATSTPGQPHDMYAKWTTLSFFSQASYNYDNRYFLDLSLREDGSSRFGPDSKWGTFWSVGASWNVMNESFMKDSKVVSSLNVFASTGTSGNSNIGTYDSYETYGFGGNFNYNGQNGSGPNAPGNSALAWETVWKNNIGVEMTLLKQYRLKLEAYINKTSNMLFAENLSITSGYSARTANTGNMFNRGVEFEWDLSLIATKDIYWKFYGNVAFSQSIMGDLPDEMTTEFLTYRSNEQYGMFYMVQFAGVDPQNGRPLWYKADGSLTNIYSTNDRVILNKSFIPTYTGGFGTDFTYKNLGVSLFFSWVGDKYMINQASNIYNSNGKFKDVNQGVDMLNGWSTPGQVTSYPDPRYMSNNADTRYLENASFLRWKNFMISYTLDQEYLKKTKLIKNAKVYVQAQNLFTFTSFRGFDPENLSPVESNVYPQSKSFTFGLDLTF